MFYLLTVDRGSDHPFYSERSARLLECFVLALLLPPHLVFSFSESAVLC